VASLGRIWASACSLAMAALVPAFGLTRVAFRTSRSFYVSAMRHPSRPGGRKTNIMSALLLCNRVWQVGPGVASCQGAQTRHISDRRRAYLCPGR